MKRYNNLYEKVISLENLRLADEKARKGKTKSYGVRLHDRNREANLLALHDALISKTFRTSKYDVFTIHEPKEREIYRLPYYPDRILHHAIMNILEPIWAKVFTYNTYSCIKGRGIHACARRVRKVMRTFDGKPLYCLKIDIKRFYPTIDHAVMKSIIRRKIKDEDLLWLLDEIIDSADGLPIGNYLSQHLSNLYLAYFMHYVNERLRLTATEYADDIVFYADNKAVLWAALLAVRDYILTLHLSLKDNWQVFPIAVNRYDRSGRALDYVGYIFYRRQVLLRKTIKVNFCKAAAHINKSLPNLHNYKQMLSAWLGWAKYSNSKHLLHRIINIDYYEKLFNEQAQCA